MALIWYCASGLIYFVGAGLIIAIVLFSPYFKFKGKIFFVYGFMIIAGTMIVLSAAPKPLWLYSIWMILAISWIAVYSRPHAVKSKRTRALQAALILTCCIGILTESPYYISPKVSPNNYRELYVIGDSVSAGLGGKRIESWPSIIGKQHNIDAINLAQAGATVDKAVSQAQMVGDSNGVIVIEIGGNDILALNPTSPDKFETELEHVLTILARPGRTIVMFELPLMPLQNQYGKVQRKLAKKFNVALIPKRYFVNVLSSEGATTDLIHLSQIGQDAMAKMVWTHIGKCFAQ